MTFIKSQSLSWIAIIVAVSVFLSITISHLIPEYLYFLSKSERINTVIYNNDYSLEFNKDEKAWLNTHSVIKLGIPRNVPPFSFFTEDKKHVGLTADYMRLIEYRTGLKFSIAKNAEWVETLEMAKAGEIDMISAIVNTEERRNFLNFSTPYVITPISIFTYYNNDNGVNTLSDLSGKKVSFVTGSYFIEEIRTKYPKIELIPFNTSSLALKEAYLGNVDAYIGHQEMANYLIKRQGYDNFFIHFPTSFLSSYSLGVVKSQRHLKSIIDKTLLSISNDDKRLLEKHWFGVETHFFIPERIAHITGLLFSTLLLFFVFWSSRLRKNEKSENESKEILKVQSEVDHLTRLGNRNKFYIQLEKNIKKGEPFTLLFLDLDMFKEVNDSYGHNIGDLLLIDASKRISMSVGELGHVSRIGSDEFMIILPGISGEKDIAHSVDYIRNQLGESYYIKGIRIVLTTSVGVTQYPSDGSNCEQLVKNVEQSMLFSKKRGRNCYSYFNKAMQKEAQYKTNLIKDLRVAVREKQFTLHYQPIVDLSTNTITKAESLIRWNHHQRGFVSPAEFIPLAEEIGVINDIGDWVFKSAVNQTIEIKNLFDPQFQMSINTSPLQYQRNNMDVAAWCRYMKQHGLSGENIIVEITEGVLMQTSQAVSENLFQLRDLKIRVAIDDFGTGYSSLSYLKKLDVDFLKIDQSFIRNLTADSDEFILVEAITIMAHKLGIKVIAEGVETLLQKKLLVEIGCDFGQGFYFSKPLKGKRFIKLLENWQKTTFHESAQKQLPL